MLTVGWLVAAVLAVALLAAWVAATVARLERLHARVDAAWAALDAQLVRRAAAVQQLLGSAPAADGLTTGRREELAALARAALDPAERDGFTRRLVENGIGRAALELVALDPTALEPAAVELAALDRSALDPTAHQGLAAGDARAVTELREAAARVLIARRFYNDAVRDARNLRGRLLPRLLRALHFAVAHRADPEFFDIDDTPPPAPAVRPHRAAGLQHVPTTEQDPA